MECKYGLKKNRNRKWIAIVIIIILIISTSAIAIKLANGKKEEKVIETMDESWGMGKNVTESVSNDRDYEWYVDQLSTGKYGAINCGPSVIEMAAKWKNKDSTLKAEEIREKILGDAPGTNKKVLCEVFDQNGVEHKDLCDCLILFGERNKDAMRSDLSYKEREDLTNQYNVKNFISTGEYEKLKQDIKQEIKDGNIVLIAMRTKYLTYNLDTEKRCGRYYSGAWAHWIIAKGYKVVDNKLYFQIYDPYGGGWTYKDGTLWGKNRYFLANEVLDGYYYSISVSK